MTIQHKLNVLHKLAAEFNKHNLVWAVGASILLYLKGYVDNFNDLDIQVTAADALKMEAILNSLGTAQPTTKENFETKYFRKFMVDGVEIDMIGGFAIVSDGKVYDCDLHPEQITDYAQLNGENIPLLAVELWRKYYHLMGRTQKVEIIDNHKSME